MNRGPGARCQCIGKRDIDLVWLEYPWTHRRMVDKQYRECKDLLTINILLLLLYTSTWSVSFISSMSHYYKSIGKLSIAVWYPNNHETIHRVFGKKYKFYNYRISKKRSSLKYVIIGIHLIWYGLDVPFKWTSWKTIITRLGCCRKIHLFTGTSILDLFSQHYHREYR